MQEGRLVIAKPDPRTRSMRRLAGALLLAFSLVMPAGHASAGELVIVGSETLANFLEPLASRFREANPETRVLVEPRHSSAGPPALLSGRAQLASLSRPMKPDELKAFEARYGRRPVPIAVASDAVAIYVNEANPLEKISLVELDAIYSSERSCGSERAITRWSQLGVEGEFGEREIGAYGLTPSSGTYAFFAAEVLCGGRFRAGIRRQPGGRSLILSIKEGLHSIGYGPRSARTPGVRALEVSVKPGYQYGSLTPAHIHEDVYPLTRDLYLYRLAPGEADPADDEVVAFIRYVLSEAGQDAVEAAGFLRLPADRIAAQLASLAGAD